MLLSFSFTKQVCVSVYLASPPQAGGRAQLDLHSGAASVGLGDGLCSSIVWFHPIKRTLEVTECPFKNVGDLCLDNTRPGLQRLWEEPECISREGY